MINLGRKITAIAAMAKNRVIGSNGSIPWHIPEDFRFFKTTTMGGILLMGRKTYESIGRPLPGRITVILSRTLSRGDAPEGVLVIKDISCLDAIAPERKVFLAGGAELYKQFLPQCSELILTEVDMEPDGDAHFPQFDQFFSEGTVLLSGENFVVKKYIHI